MNIKFVQGFLTFTNVQLLPFIWGKIRDITTVEVSRILFVLASLLISAQETNLRQQRIKQNNKIYNHL